MVTRSIGTTGFTCRLASTSEAPGCIKSNAHSVPDDRSVPASLFEQAMPLANNDNILPQATHGIGNRQENVPADVLIASRGGMIRGRLRRSEVVRVVKGEGQRKRRFSSALPERGGPII